MKIYFAETIKNLRLQKKLTQEQLADVFCVSPQAVYMQNTTNMGIRQTTGPLPRS